MPEINPVLSQLVSDLPDTAPPGRKSSDSRLVSRTLVHPNLSSTRRRRPWTGVKRSTTSRNR